MSAILRCANVAGLFSEGIEEQGVAVAASGSSRASLHGASRKDRARRLAAVALACLTRRRLNGLLPMLDLFLRDWAVDANVLPDPALALSRPEGLCGAARDLSPNRMMEAYSLGLHARAPAGPVTWWAPASRKLVVPGHGTAAEALALDRATSQVMALCAAQAVRESPMRALTSDLLRAQVRLADRGFIHSFSLGDAGGYGLALGRVFVVLGVHGGREALRAAFSALDCELDARGFALIDVTFAADALDGIERHEMARADYNAMLAINPDNGKPGRWQKRPLERKSVSPLLSLSQAMARAA